MLNHSITVITPTTGKDGLDKLIETIAAQGTDYHKVYHLLLWDNKREDTASAPESYNSADRCSIVFPAGTGRNGAAPGSKLRAIGLILAKTPWVTFADDDVWWEANHLQALAEATVGKHWGSTLRTVWAPDGDKIGIDRFESVGDDPSRRVPYEMCDGNTIVCKRELGVVASQFYRETTEYNDDRLMYAFLKEKAGPRGSTNIPTINQTCPIVLTDFFRQNCSAE